VKTHPHLLVRDALAEVFVEASEGGVEADRALDALVRWAREGIASPPLLDVRAAEGTPLFLPDGRLDASFEELEEYARDRAVRFEAARRWIREQHAEESAIERARAAWDAGLFFEVHEILEPVWLADRSPRRDALQGLILAAAGLHHLCDGNRAGASGLCRHAARRLRRAPESFPVQVEPLAKGLEDLEKSIERGEVEGPNDVEEIPPFLPRGS
jgi:hypothetical protein